ncbi:hypothetical protein SLV14_004492 [Streptomyces sp. Je 1-4]|uniref:hypothetical protein n=1 Tax=Streptomyces TaxID=1883 RepID=UPI0021DAB4E4|nr:MULTISPECIES: hypothetical protein [unclassified Streptomyces]UYB41703.1 hypothetical protein SLV14_004492 [Streptomyces sp. Je 1-4]UZQ37961.1 hypothetical protein SLV14N_004492 [Streptomyces sp. Je 1-4] [Streptomyces sp. Je 1-4 4N24]UZQ45378.1 hypothetical protein SLV14NA_004492 [Streptomyces sp. Je 1-4] [Streptomyces sp. Je 1-4 4N24_ara]
MSQIYSARGARQMDAATVAKANAEADLLRAQAAAATGKANVDVERVRREAAAQARRERRREREENATARRERRRAAFAQLGGQMGAHRVTLVTVAVIALFVSVALPAQIDFLGSRWAWPMAVAGGVSLESLTWMFAIQGQRREQRGLSAGVHRAGTWSAALVAAGINLAHGAQMWGFGFGVVAAVGSLAAPVAYETYRLSVSEDDTGASPEEIRHNRRRRRHHRKVHRAATRLRWATVPPMDEARAWETAWRMVHAAEPGVTRRELKRHTKRAGKVAQLVTEHADAGPLPSLELFTGPRTDAPAAVPELERTGSEEGGGERTQGRTDGPANGPYEQVRPRTPQPPKPTRTPPVRPARTGARAASDKAYEDAELERTRQRAEEAYAQSLDAGTPIGPAALGREFGFSEGWARKRIKAVDERRTTAARQGLHLVTAAGQP